MSETLRQYSKRNHASSSGSLESLNAGSLQRIADAYEQLKEAAK